MTTRVLIIGGYGNFGAYIARALASDPKIQLLIGGRSKERAEAFAAGLDAVNPAIGCPLDIDSALAKRLAEIRPEVVIHTTGPFQGQDYRVPRAAIAAGAHYVDLADARSFVARIGALNDEAQAAGVAVVSGASSVPCLTAAFLDHYAPRFARLECADYGISAAQATNRGLGTAAAILSYVGKPISTLKGGRYHHVHGWQDLHAVRYPGLGTRLFGACDIPDLELFPNRYPDLRTLRFSAGHEVKLLHLGTWLLSWPVRWGWVRSLAPYSKALLNLSFLFDPLGSAESGFHMFLSGTDRDGSPKSIWIFMIARRGHGPNIPCIPAILLARRIAAGKPPPAGATPCLDLIDLPSYLAALEELDVTVTVQGDDARF